MAVALATQLDEVQDAISAILTRGQRLELGSGDANRRIDRAELAELRKMESDLLRRISRASGKGVRVAVPEI